MKFKEKIKKIEALLEEVTEFRGDLPAFDKSWLDAEPVLKIDELTMKRILKKRSNFRSYRLAGIAALSLITAGIFSVVILQKGFIVTPSEDVQKAEKLRGLVLRVRGEVHIEKNGVQKRLYQGEVVERGNSINTDKGEVDIALSSGTILRLKEEGNFHFEKLDKTKNGSDTEIFLEKGSLFNVVNRLSEKDTYVVKTPTAIAGVRGTSFLVTASPDKTEIHITKGSVAVTASRPSYFEREKILEEGDAGITINLKGEHRSVDMSSSEKITSEFMDLTRSSSEMESDVFDAAQDLSEAKTEEELKRNYNKDLIEIIRMKDGRELHGLVVSQVGRKIIFQTVAESYVLNADEVMDISYKDER